MKISKELQDTVAGLSHIEQVYFAKNGEHFFHVHELKVKGKGTGKYYGRLGVENVLARTEGDRKIYKQEFVAMPELLITDTVDREAILNAKVEGDPADEKAAILKSENETLKQMIADLEQKQKEAAEAAEKAREEAASAKKEAAEAAEKLKKAIEKAK